MADPKTILVTGVTCGLGHALTHQIIAKGHTLWGCGRNSLALKKMSLQYPAPHLFRQVDVSDWTQVSAWAQRLTHSDQSPDLIINNAGIINQNAPLWEVSAVEFDTLMRINVSGPVNMIRGFLPAMIHKGHGVVVNVSSGWGRSTAPEVAPYCASKFAIEGLTRALAQELPPGLAAVTVNPGVINTAMLQSCWGDGAQNAPLPDQWAEKAVDFLLGLDATHNGQALTVT